MGIEDRDYYRDRSWRRRKPSQPPARQDRSSTAVRAREIAGESYPPSAAAPAEAYSPMLADGAKRRHRRAVASALAALAFVGVVVGVALSMSGACA